MSICFCSTMIQRSLIRTVWKNSWVACMRKDVGAVGARLYYEDDTIQHAGVVIGFPELQDTAFVQQKRGTTGYCHRIICAQDYSAVTAACMMVKKSAFDAGGGLSEELAVAFNDIDFCMKLRKGGISDRCIIHMRNYTIMNPNPEVLRILRKSGTI